MEQKIRNLPAKTIVTLDELAKQNGQSRESYIRDLLNHHVLSAEVEGLNMKYETLVQTMSQELKKKLILEKRKNQLTD